MRCFIPTLPLWLHFITESYHTRTDKVYHTKTDKEFVIRKTFTEKAELEATGGKSSGVYHEATGDNYSKIV